jgi:hypothetical protein
MIPVYPSSRTLLDASCKSRAWFPSAFRAFRCVSGRFLLAEEFGDAVVFLNAYFQK